MVCPNLKQGNDATYTLQALIGLAIKGLKPEEARSPRTKEQRVEQAQQAMAEARMSKDFEGWTATSDVEEDGDISEPLQI